MLEDKLKELSEEELNEIIKQLEKELELLKLQN